MTTFIAINDLHLTTRPPASRVDDYISEMLDLLLQVQHLRAAIRAEAVLIAGDVFHLKGPISYELLYWLYHWGRQVKATAIPGNHDLDRNAYESLPKTALGFLFNAGAFHNLAAQPQWFSNGVYVAGIPFPNAMQFDQWKTVPSVALDNGQSPGPHQYCRCRIVLGHCFATLDGGTYFGEPVLSYRDLSALPFEVFVFGHDHKDLGAQQVNGKWFINLGALSRGSIADDDIQRQVKCAVITIPAIPDEGPVEVTEVVLNARPAAELFDLAQRAQQKAELSRVEAFVTELSSDLHLSTMAVPVSTLTERVQALKLPDAIYHRVMQYIETAEADV